MRLLYLSFVFSFLCFVSNAQTPLGEATDFGEFLVELAWKNHPTSTIYQQQKDIADLQVGKARTGYWDALLPFVNFTGGAPSFGGNVVPDNPNVAGGLGFGVSFRLTPLYATEYDIAIAKAERNIVDLEMETDLLAVRSKVLTYYEQWILSQKVVDKRRQVEVDARENQRLVLELFKQDGAEYEDINAASSAFQKAVEDRLTAEMQIKLAALALEEWIGMSLAAAQLLFMVR